MRSLSEVLRFDYLTLSFHEQLFCKAANEPHDFHHPLVWTFGCLCFFAAASKLTQCSFTGIGGGRIPYDVNTALMPAALRSIAALSDAGLFPAHSSWSTLASEYAQIWEDSTLQFFEITIPSSEARSRLGTYVSRASFPGPNQTDAIPDGEDVVFHALSLDGYNNLSQVAVMNTDDCFRHFLLNTTNQTQLTHFINQTASNIRRTFPAGLLTSVGMLVANPAYGEEPVYAANY